MRAVLLDVGGVLEVTPASHWIHKWEKRLELDDGGLARAVSPIWRPGRIGAASLHDIERQTADLLCLDAADSRAFWNDMWTWYLGTLNGQLMEFLATLRPKHQLAILSNSFVGAREREQARYRFEHLFDPIIYSHEEGLEKPDARFCRLACKRLNLPAEDILIVDDSAGHVTAAEAVGMRGVVFRDTATAIRDIKRYLTTGDACDV